MAMQEAIVQILEGTPPLTALVSSRIYPLRLPHGVDLPALTYRLVSAPRDQTQDGPSGLTMARVQVSAWATDYDQAKAIATAVRQGVQGYRGELQGVRVDSIRMINETDLDDPEPGIYQIAMDFAVDHAEALA